MSIWEASNPEEIEHAAARARAGDRIRIAPGLYARAALIDGLSGTADDPIVFEPLAEGPISGGSEPDYWAGRGLPSEGGPGSPKWTDLAFLKFRDCHNIEVRDFELRDYWPVIFHVRSGTGFHFLGNRMRHGTNAIFMRGCAHVRVVENHWQQDDTPQHTLWSEVDWVEAHGGDGGEGTKRFYNGSFFAGKDTSDVLIRANHITDCYNGVRLKVDSAPGADAAPTNARVRIVDNDFVRIRDNPIEAEVYAFDWHVTGNRIEDAHAWFSFDGVRGGYFYIYGNTARFSSRQGDPEAGSHTMGRVLKLSYRLSEGQDQSGSFVPDHPWYVFNNSFVLRCPVIGGGGETVPQLPCAGIGPDFTRGLTFVNNAFEWCRQDDHGVHVCEWIAMLRNFHKREDDGVTFEASLTNRQDYIDQARSLRVGEADAVLTLAALFEAPSHGDFALVPDSPGRGNARRLTLLAPNGGQFEIRLNGDGTLHRGAVQDYGLVTLDLTEVPVA